MATVDFDIREVLEGMKALNAMKADMKILLHLALPYLSKIAQAKVNKEAGSSYIGKTTVVFNLVKGCNHLVFSCNNGSNFLALSLIFQDNIGAENVVVRANRHQRSGYDQEVVFRVEELSKWDTVPCFDLVQQMMLWLWKEYPGELAKEIAPFLEAASRTKTK